MSNHNICFLYGKFEKTRAVRRSDYSTVTTLSEEKDILIPVNWRQQTKWRTKQTNKQQQHDFGIHDISKCTKFSTLGFTVTEKSVTKSCI